MRRTSIRRTALFAIPIALALGLAACGSDNTGSSASQSTAKATTTSPSSSGSSSSTTAMAGGTAVVKLSSSKYGQILTDTQGNTLYVFMKDTGSTSNCSGASASTWPALAVTGTPSGTGISASDLATTMRTDGTTQVTFHGHPVYHYAGDSAAGDTTGQGIGGIWFVVDKDGNAVKSATASSPTTTASSGSGY